MSGRYWVHTIVWSVLLTAVVFACAPTVSNAAAVAVYVDSTVASDWIAKSICVDAQDRPVPADPYYDCPFGTTLRKIKLGDPLPYHNMDQWNQQGSDDYPAAVPIGSTPLYVATFDFAPFNQYNTFDGSDGFDTYHVEDGWVSSGQTRDGGGYGQTFFGANCALKNGWIYFPTSGFLSGGHAKLPIAGSWWEQSRLSYPGICHSDYSNPHTYWEFHSAYPYGGINGNVVKYMDTMISYHGYDPDYPYDHLEVFYFTQQYGKTKWEAWVPLSEHPTKANTCGGSDVVYYQGIAFVIVDCRDWSQVLLQADAGIPEWPLSETNLLQHAHFDDGGGYLSSNDDATMGLWHRGGNSVEGNIINWSLRNSTVARDTRISPVGVRYLATNCGGTCTGPGVQEIYQEVPISSFVDNGTYLFGLDGRTESGSGTIKVTLQELDANDRVLWSDSLQGTLSPYNGTLAATNKEFTDSVYLSSGFLHKLTTIPVLSVATRIRYYITPLTSQSFDILQTWLNPFPTLRSGLGTIPSQQPATVTLQVNGGDTLNDAKTNETFTLDWYSSLVNVDSCKLYTPSNTTGISVAANASGRSTDSLSTAGTYTYTLTCTGIDGRNVSQSVTVTAVYPPPRSALMQGYRVLQNNAPDDSAQTVTIDGGPSSYENPYGFTVQAGTTYTARVPTRTGYTIGYTACTDRTDCHSGTPTSGNVASISVPSGSGHYIDLWWHYTPSIAPTPDLVAGGTAVPQTVIPSEPVALSSSVVNIVSGSTATNVPNVFQIADSESATATILQRIDTSPSTVSSLAAGVSVLVTGFVPVNSLAVGTYYVRLCANHTAAGSWSPFVPATTESNIDNNCGPWNGFTVATVGLGSSARSVIASFPATFFSDHPLTLTQGGPYHLDFGDGSRITVTSSICPPDSSGSCTLSTSHTYTTPGSYNAVLYNGSVPIGGEPITVIAPLPTLTTTPATLSVRGTLSVSQTNPQSPDPGAWIGLFRKGDPLTQASLSMTQTWIYANSCSHTKGSTGSTQNTCPLTLDPAAVAGTYIAELFGDDTFARPLARSADITVTSASPLAGTAGALPLQHSLAIGWTGPEVTTLQSLLSKLGYYADEVTGYFGSATETAVKGFQSENNLSAVGIVGPQTRSLLLQSAH